MNSLNSATFEDSNQLLSAYKNNGSEYGNITFELPVGYTVEINAAGGQNNYYMLLNNANGNNLKNGDAGTPTTIRYKNTTSSPMELVFKFKIMQIKLKVKAEEGNTVTLKNKSNYYNLIFNKNCSATVSGMPTNITKCLEGEDVHIPNTWPERTYYEFYGWSTNPNATSATYLPNSTINITSNTTLYAVWKEDTHKLTIRPYGKMKSKLSEDWFDGEVSTTFTYGQAKSFATTAQVDNKAAFIVDRAKNGTDGSWTFYSNRGLFRGWYIEGVDSSNGYLNGADKASSHVKTARSNGETIWTFDGKIDGDVTITALWGPVAYDYFDIKTGRDNTADYIEYTLKGVRASYGINFCMAPSWTMTNGQDDLIGGGAWASSSNRNFHMMQGGNGEWYYKLSLAKHGTNFVSGETYITHFYAWPEDWTESDFYNWSAQNNGDVCFGASWYKAP